METPASLADALASLAQTGILDTFSLKQVLARISSTISDYYARNATTATLTLEDKVLSLSKTYGESRAKDMLIESLKIVKKP